MAKRFAKLQRIDYDGQITREYHYEFIFQLQMALLLALREMGRLNATQYRYAEEKLKQQRCERAKRKQEGQ